MVEFVLPFVDIYVDKMTFCSIWRLQKFTFICILVFYGNLNANLNGNDLMTHISQSDKFIDYRILFEVSNSELYSIDITLSLPGS